MFALSFGLAFSFNNVGKKNDSKVINGSFKKVPESGSCFEQKNQFGYFRLKVEPGESLGFLSSNRIRLYWQGSHLPKAVGLTGFKLHQDTRWFLANGLQSWTKSPLIGTEDVLSAENFWRQEYFGDHSWVDYPERPGEGHSWSFSYTALPGKSANPFFASICEDDFLTCFIFDLQQSDFDIWLDTDGYRKASADVSEVCLGDWIVPRSDSEFFLPLSESVRLWKDTMYANARVERNIEIKNHQEDDPHLAETRFGYTSWYYKYRDISPEWLDSNLAAICQGEKTFLKYFQIDDGYQTRVGDWLQFTNGFDKTILSRLAADAKKNGLIPGIWWAPFIAMEDSAVVLENPDWILRDEVGQPVQCGDFPHWGGRFFALDTENPEFLDYLESVAEVFFAGMGFQFVKSDFLYAAGRIGSGGKTRAQRSVRAHQWLHDLCKKYGVELLSCGSILSNAYGRCEYVRIGPDVCLDWESHEMAQYTSREKVSCGSAMLNTLTRSVLNGVFFGNDPDVFILREKVNTLNFEEQQALATTQALHGNLVFTSDYLGEYRQAAWQNLNKLLQRVRDRTKLGEVVEVQKIGAIGIGIVYSNGSGSYIFSSPPSAKIRMD